MPFTFKHAVCNEALEHYPFHDACKTIRSIGYTGIEIAPFTLSETPGSISKEKRRQYRGIISSEGLQFAGLHWLMVAPKGLHVTTPDDSLREKSWQHILDLIDLCADLGDGGVMVFGSPKQRCTVDGSTVAEARSRFEDGLAAISGHAMQRSVTILVEALPAGQCDVVQTLAEAVEIVRKVGSPAIRTMFDSHNAVDEKEPHADLVDRYFEYIRHVHVNEMDGRHPGAGNYDFKPVLEVLKKRNYNGWVSLEAFDFTPGAERLASESLRYLESEIAQLPA
jgi:D-psicose/D-tagatose/L-ribulose 3-epimerase